MRFVGFRPACWLLACSRRPLDSACSQRQGCARQRSKKGRKRSSAGAAAGGWKPGGVTAVSSEPLLRQQGLAAAAGAAASPQGREGNPGNLKSGSINNGFFEIAPSASASAQKPSVPALARGRSAGDAFELRSRLSSGPLRSTVWKGQGHFFSQTNAPHGSAAEAGEAAGASSRSSGGRARARG